MEEQIEDYCTSSLDVIEQVIHSVVTEFSVATNDRQQELMELCHQVLEYAVLLEVVFPPSRELVEHLRELIRQMSTSVKQNVVLSRGRPRIEIGQEQLEYLVESQFRIEDSICSIVVHVLWKGECENYIFLPFHIQQYQMAN